MVQESGKRVELFKELMPGSRYAGADFRNWPTCDMLGCLREVSYQGVKRTRCARSEAGSLDKKSITGRSLRLGRILLCGMSGYEGGPMKPLAA
jgi:hypothetical protein